MKSQEERYIAAVEKQAYEWLAVMRSGKVSGQDDANFRAWLNADPRHQAVYEQVSEVWEDLGALRGEFAPASYRGALSFRQKALVLADACRAWAFSVRGAMLSGAMAVVILAGILYFHPVDDAVTQGTFATETAEIRVIHLADDSFITLGARSVIDIDYGHDERRVALIAGEAFFSVAKDPQRPFVVKTAETEIRVTGTQFEVRRTHQTVRVAVLEGTVEVVQLTAAEIDALQVPGTRRATLSASQNVTTSPDRAVLEPRRTTQAQPGAWRQGRLIYDDTRLEEVIADASRYYQGNIIIDNEAAKNLRVSASFKADQIGEMMDSLSASLPISTRRLSNGDIVIR